VVAAPGYPYPIGTSFKGTGIVHALFLSGYYSADINLKNGDHAG
jgi:hypothetical protein